MFNRAHKHPFRVLFVALTAFWVGCGGGAGGLDPPDPDPRITAFTGSDVVTPGHSEEYRLQYIPATTTCTLSDASGAGLVVQGSVAPTSTIYNYMVGENTTAEGTTAPLNALCTGATGTTPATSTKPVLIAHKAFAQFLAASQQVARLNSNATYGLQVSPFTRTCSGQLSFAVPPGFVAVGPTTSADCQSVSFKLPTMPVGSLVPGSGVIPGQERYVVELGVMVATEDARYPARPTTLVEIVAGDPSTETLTVSDVICADINDGTSKKIDIHSNRPLFSKGNGTDYIGTKISPFGQPVKITPVFVTGSESTDIYIFMSGCLPPGNYVMGVSNPGQGGGSVQATWRVLTSAASGPSAAVSASPPNNAVKFWGGSEQVLVRPVH